MTSETTTSGEMQKILNNLASIGWKDGKQLVAISRGEAHSVLKYIRTLEKEHHIMEMHLKGIAHMTRFSEPCGQEARGWNGAADSAKERAERALAHLTPHP